MKNERFIRTATPLSLAVFAFFDILSILLGAAAVYAVVKHFSFITAGFVLIMAVVLAAAVLGTRRLIKNGICFYDDKMVLTVADDSEYFYGDIESIKTIKDDRVSLKKNYVQRYSLLVLQMKDGRTVTTELGATTKKKLRLIEQEIHRRIKEEKSV